MNSHKKVVIVGAGPTGLGAAIRLEQLGYHNWELFEAGSEPGGLASSAVDKKGFTWDLGGHVIFSHYQYFNDLLSGALPEWFEHQRESWVWMRDCWAPYPLQNNIHRLPEDVQVECMSGLLALRPSGTKPNNFQEWVDQNFGKGLAKHFLNPYNFKVWAYPLSDMSAQWMGERVALVDVSRVCSNIIKNKDDVSWGPNATFKFPAYGGTGAIWKAVAAMLPQEKLHFNSKVEAVYKDSRTIVLGNGDKHHYDLLLSSMPLHLLLKALSGEGTEPLKPYIEKFRWSASHIVGIGLKGSAPDHLEGKCWMYFPEDDCPFYRVTVFSHYSPNNVPKGDYWSLMMEVSESICKEAPKDVIEACIQGALNTKLIASRDEVVSTWHTRLTYGYPTPFLLRDEVLNAVQPVLQNWNIWSRGRFGGWKYEVSNQDHSLMQGVEAVDCMLFGVEESTYFYPDMVNSRKVTTRSWKKPLSTG